MTETVSESEVEAAANVIFGAADGTFNVYGARRVALRALEAAARISAPQAASRGRQWEMAAEIAGRMTTGGRFTDVDVQQLAESVSYLAGTGDRQQPYLPTAADGMEAVIQELINADGSDGGDELAPLCHQAAALIRRLVAQLASQPKQASEEIAAILRPIAAISLWRDQYPDGPDIVTDDKLNFVTPDQIRAARALLSHFALPAAPAGKVDFQSLSGTRALIGIKELADRLIREAQDDVENTSQGIPGESVPKQEEM